MAFLPETAGQINRKFSQVTPDGGTYCYEFNERPISNYTNARTYLFEDLSTEIHMLVQMPREDELLIGRESGGEFCLSLLSYSNHMSLLIGTLQEPRLTDGLTGVRCYRK